MSLRQPEGWAARNMKMRGEKMYLLECPEIMVTFNENQVRAVPAYRFVPIKQIFTQTASVEPINRCSAAMGSPNVPAFWLRHNCPF